ncbi:MAG: hypothetical protein U0800_04940 [Isosphaeraceae bacterium]
MRVTVYLCGRVVRDRHGSIHRFMVERLARQSETDRVLAVIDAPPGSSIRWEPDQHGFESLHVPRGRGFWERWFARKHSIPVKYLIQEARNGYLGLCLVEYRPVVSEGVSLQS